MGQLMRAEKLIKKMLNFSELQGVILDWDETVTDRDSLDLIFRIAFRVKPEFPYKLNHFVGVYKDRYRDYVEHEVKGSVYETRDTVEREIQYQQGMKPVELSSVNEARRLGLFEGIHREKFVNYEQTLGQSSDQLLPLKPGVIELLKMLYRRVPITILSVNWTSLMMKQRLKEFGFDEDKKWLHFLVNELVFDEHCISTGNTTGEEEDIRTGYDKMIKTRRIIKDCPRGKHFVYFGDSSTDVLAMIETGNAIALGTGARDQLTRMGFKVEGLEGEESMQDLCEEAAYIFAKDFTMMAS
ncbi:BA75_01416T0 [Komagataella pastoris]|uniref:BA75_01416T0 n=1 Tax=Komagataella pastoris TaxID=4922 RepID=A0A1B2J5P0_PICPA|nr:BA75_01416T0 [Komagataella pastoris]